MQGGGVASKVVQGTEAAVPGKANNWKTVSTEFLGFAPADHGPVPSHIMKAIWAFDPAALPIWIRRAYRTHDNKLTIRVFNGLAYQSFLPSFQGKEPIYLFRPTSTYKFNGPIYEDQVFEWYPRNVNRRDIPGVYLPWDEHRLLALRSAYWRMYGRYNGVEKTAAEQDGTFVSKEDQLKKVIADGKDRLQDVAGPFQNPYVGFTGKEFRGN